MGAQPVYTRSEKKYEKYSRLMDLQKSRNNNDSYILFLFVAIGIFFLITGIKKFIKIKYNI